MATRTKAKPKPQPEPEVDEVEEEELDELDEDAEEEAPTKAAKSRDDEVTFGAAHLARLLSKKTGKTIKPRDLRTLLRKMAKDGRIDRVIVPGNRSRYDWPEKTADPEVKAVIKAVMAGELEAGKKEALDRLKANKAAKDAAAAKTKKAAPAKKAKKAAPVVEDIEDDEDFELDDEE